MPQDEQPTNLIPLDDDIASPTRQVGKGTRVRGNPIEWARAKAAEATARRHEAQAALVLQQVLPLWSDDMRGVPNPMIRSGLFGARNARTRQNFDEQNVVSLSNFEILYTGKELLQDDLSVWMALINMASRQPLGDAIFFSGYQLVKDLRTEHETGNVQSVLDGDLDQFMEAWLRWQRAIGQN